ncbi:acetyltransferase (GNAT) domain-containing protein [Hirsutella rhossiliensis]|uniref:Acetyltransferase (GNAT) domain-containing protein n=1 Tax=Hirsutella rhossiliensis TaxID=111463 RepID=A0A9P8MNE2_9HYPO|nr:acetyltransferase (GNAT) domain-containing protein [Hirsutella rhossiliensis]KAH0958330.1 acetyltransferase (GNAT) domain-containing protein [Hirsutella rhossiliensis]
MTTPPPEGYRFRAGLPSDLDAVAGLYDACFARDALVDMLFPARRAAPRGDFRTHLYRHFERRWWTPGWVLGLLVVDHGGGGGGHVVGFAWWRRPDGDLGVWERWCTPCAWLAPLMRLYVSLKNRIRPTAVQPRPASALDRVMAALEPRLPRLRPDASAAHPAAAGAAAGGHDAPSCGAWWYLSALAVLPALQGKGLGAGLLRHGLRDVDGVCYLVGVAGVERFYRRHGFVEVARANVGELAAWDGGAVMVRG